LRVEELGWVAEDMGGGIVAFMREVLRVDS
jgi:hypothetical protein